MGLLINGQVGWRAATVIAPSTPSLWTSVYAVYNADATGSSSLKTSLFAAYNGESNANDSFGSNNGTAVGGLTYTTGKIGNAFTFNGTNSYVSLPTNSLNSLTGNFSVSFWMKLNDTQPNFGMLVSNLQTSNGGVQYHGWQLGFTSGLLYFLVGTGLNNTTNSRLVSNTITNYIGNWVHIVCTRNTSTGYKIYVNNVLNNSNSFTYGPSNTASHTPTIGAQMINASPIPGYLLNGSLDAVSVWNKELTQSEITELYNSGNGAQYIGDNFYKPTPNDALNTYNGTAIGGLTYGVGKVGTAFNFNGTNAYVSLPNNSFNNLTGDFSVSFWMNLNNSHPTDFGMLFSNLQFPVDYSTYYGFQIGFYNGQIYFTVGSNTGNSTASTRLLSSTLSGYIGTWVHVTCTHKQSTGYKIYVNGSLNTSNNGTYNPVYTTNHTPSIGAQYSVNNSPNNLTYKINGSIDALNIYQKELTQSEITELYNSGNGKQYTI